MAVYGDLKPGTLLGGRYRIERELGRGAFGVVFRAVHEVLGRPDRPGFAFRPVALKLFVNKYLTRENAPEAFREAMALESLAAEARLLGDRPHVAEVFDLGVFEDYFHQPYVVMEYVAGGSLEATIRLGIPARRAVALLRQVCAGVRLAHAHGIYHRDLKPGNILFTPSGFLKVSDFGVMIRRDDAFVTGGPAGTISYAAPEMSTGTALVTGAYDVYSLGIMLLEFLLKRNPLEDVCQSDRTSRHDGEGLRQAQRLLAELRDPRTHAPVADSLTELREDRALQEILRRCLRFDADERYRNAAELDDALARWEAGTPAATATRRRPTTYAELLDRARQDGAAGDWTTAEATLREAQRLNDRDVVVCFRLAEALAAMGRWKDAIVEQETGIRRSTRAPRALDRLATLYENDGRPREAAALRDEARGVARGTRR